MVEYNREEIADESDDVAVDDTLEPEVEQEELAEGDDGEEGASEWEEIPGDTIFPIPYVNQYGEEELLEMSYADIVNAVREVKSGALQEKENFIANALPVINRMVQSDLMKGIDQYLALGYSDEQLIRMMPDVISGVVPAQKQQIAMDPNDPIAMIKEVVRTEITPIKNQFESAAQQQAKQAVIRQNDEALTKAFDRHGIKTSDLTGTDLTILKQTLNDMYPNTSFENIRLTQSQAYIIANDAVPKMQKAKGGKKPSNIQGAMKQAKAPAVISGKETSGLRPKKATMPNPKGVSIDERRQSFLNLIQ